MAATSVRLSLPPAGIGADSILLVPLCVVPCGLPSSSLGSIPSCWSSSQLAEGGGGVEDGEKLGRGED